MATYAIGDIQGCYQEFRDLLDECGFETGRDTLWLVGDLVNRGPNNLDVMRFVMNTPGVRAVLGNHDLHFLAIAYGYAEQGRRDTLNDLLESAECSDICEWIRTRPLIHVDDARQQVMVHAGLPPQWDVLTCAARAAEVETVLRGPDVEQFLAQMYGNEPATWSEDLTGNSRLRLIINYFTRLRFCRQDGTMELESKETEAPDGYAPWFSFPRPDDYTIVFGHWAALEGHTGRRDAIALDTGCVWGRKMTALRIDDDRRFSVPSRMPDAIG